MARKKLIETRDDAANKTKMLSKLSKLVSNWGANKSIMDSYKKPVNNDAAEIKQIMMANGLEESSSGKFIAKLSFTVTEDIDEDATLQYIKSVLWADKGSMECPYIERVERVNWDAIEKAMYNGTITKEQILEMDKFKTVTKTPKLNLKVVEED